MSVSIVPNINYEHALSGKIVNNRGVTVSCFALLTQFVRTEIVGHSSYFCGHWVQNHCYLVRWHIYNRFKTTAYLFCVEQPLLCHQSGSTYAVRNRERQSSKKWKDVLWKTWTNSRFFLSFMDIFFYLKCHLHCKHTCTNTKKQQRRIWFSVEFETAASISFTIR